MKNLETFLEFNGKRITVLHVDGSWHLAIRPICEALEVDFHAQYKTLKNDDILFQLLSKQTTVGADSKMREMVCMPEKYVYGWLFSISSNSPSLREYKLKCYDILYNHFHGAMTARMNVLTEQDTIALKIAALEESLLDSEQYKQIQELKKRRGDTTKELKRLDLELKSGQIAFSFS
jgi:hypothetical protein